MPSRQPAENVKETICRECLKHFPDARILVEKGTLRVVEPPCDFCEEGQ